MYKTKTVNVISDLGIESLKAHIEYLEQCIKDDTHGIEIARENDLVIKQNTIESIKMIHILNLEHAQSMLREAERNLELVKEIVRNEVEKQQEASKPTPPQPTPPAMSYAARYLTVEDIAEVSFDIEALYVQNGFRYSVCKSYKELPSELKFITHLAVLSYIENPNLSCSDCHKICLDEAEKRKIKVNTTPYELLSKELHFAEELFKKIVLSFCKFMDKPLETSSPATE